MDVPRDSFHEKDRLMFNASHRIAVTLAALLITPPAAARVGGIDLTICHGFGCTIEESVSISIQEWRQITAYFSKPAETARGERVQIRKAVGWFEVIMGRYTPIHLDRGRDEFPDRFNDAKPVGQMDCIDEARNTTTYLSLMERAGLFRHHRVVERAYRRTLWDQHYAGQIEEVKTGERWVVDSWFHDFGKLPHVARSTEWADVPFLFRNALRAETND